MVNSYQDLRIQAHVSALGQIKSASDSLTGNLLAELAIAVSGTPDWSKLTNADITAQAIESMLDFSCKAFAIFGESESARVQFQTNEKRRILLVLKKFSVTGKLETVYRLSTGTTSKPVAFAPQCDNKGFIVGLRFTVKTNDSDPFEGFEADSEIETAKEEIDRLNAEKVKTLEDKAIQDRAVQLATAMSVKTQQALDEQIETCKSYADELHELRNRLAVQSAELFNANEKILSLEADNAKLTQAVAEFDLISKPTPRTRKARV